MVCQDLTLCTPRVEMCFSDYVAHNGVVIVFVTPSYPLSTGRMFGISLVRLDQVCFFVTRLLSCLFFFCSRLYFCLSPVLFGLRSRNSDRSKAAKEDAKRGWNVCNGECVPLFACSLKRFVGFRLISSYIRIDSFASFLERGSLFKHTHI